MRVPSIGLTLDERRIVREGYRLAERLMRGYEEPRGDLAKAAGFWLKTYRQTVQRLYREFFGA